MSIDIPDVARAIQWKIYDHLVFASLLQQISRAGRNKTLLAMAIVFVESKHFLPESIASDENSPFCAYTMAIGLGDAQLAEEIISTLYKNNYQVKKKKVPTPYHAVDPAILWLINTIGCRRYLALACFMSNNAFKGQTHLACCNNCIYSARDEEGAIPDFERHDITAQHCRQYLKTNKYQQILKDQAATARQWRGRKTFMGNQKTVIDVLTAFAEEKWPRGMDKLMFSASLREQIAKAAVQIENVEDLCKELNPICNLAISTLKAYAKDIVSIIQQTIAPTQQGSIQLRPQDDEDSSDSTEHVNESGPSQVTQGQGGGQESRGRGPTAKEPRARGKKRRRRPRNPTVGVGGGVLMDWTQNSK